MSDALKKLSDAGVSIWLDDLSRERINSGNLKELLDSKHVVGVTTNPTIFANALAKGDAYTEQVTALAAKGTKVDQAVFEITTDDVRQACDILDGVYEATDHLDGRVSIEVEPGFAHKTQETVDTAKLLWATVDRPNAMIKIPATVEGLPAITSTLAEGISVNVTLIFGIERYRAVMDAYLSGLEQAKANGKDLSQIASVASFFVSRVDTEIDKRLDAVGTEEAKALKGKAGIANTILAYQAYEEVIASSRWQTLAADGGLPQRPLWASTGVKDPSYSDTMYVDQLVAPGIVNTMPEATLDAVADHAVITGDTVQSHYAEAADTFAALAAVGIDIADVTAVLEREGVDKFNKSWDELLQTVSDELERLSATDSEGA